MALTVSKFPPTWVHFHAGLADWSLSFDETPSAMEHVTLKVHRQRLRDQGFHQNRKGGRSSSTFVNDGFVCKQQILIDVDDELYSTQVFDGGSQFEEALPNQEWIEALLKEGPSVRLTDAHYEYMRQMTTHLFEEEEVEPLKRAAAAGLTPAFHSAYVVDLPTHRLHLGIIVQEKAPFVFDTLNGRSLEKRLIDVGYGKLLSLIKRLAAAELAHCDLNPGNLVLLKGGRSNIGVIDLAATCPSFCGKTGVRWQKPLPKERQHRERSPLREKKEDRLRNQRNIQKLWRQTLMMHKFVGAWKSYASAHEDFCRAIWRPMQRSMRTFKTGLRNVLQHNAHPESPISDRALFDVDVFYWGGDGGTHES